MLAEQADVDVNVRFWPVAIVAKFRPFADVQRSCLMRRKARDQQLKLEDERGQHT